VVIYCDLSKETRDVFSEHFGAKVKSLEFVEVDSSVSQNVNYEYMSQSSYGFSPFLRTLSPELLPDDKHVIYLDCDIILQDNILNILNGADLSRPVCAVTDYDPAYKWRDLSKISLEERISNRNPLCVEAFFYKTYINLELDKDAKYFNSGVMIINLDYWREYKIAERAFHFILEHPDRLYLIGQDDLNHVLNGNYFALKPKWNSMSCYDCAFFTNYPAEELLEGKKYPSIVHAKGWAYACPGKFKKLYWKYRKCTPWHNRKESERKSLIAIIKIYLKYKLFIWVGLVYIKLFHKYDKSFCSSLAYLAFNYEDFRSYIKE
jgi:lipopolysaccharide biosynthesis glycosyltransferase